MLNRRTAIKQFLFVSAGVALMPSCMQDKSKASIILKNFSIDGDQEKMLAEISETIIPKTNTPGAKDISAHLFALKMVDDCYKKEDREKFVKGLKTFEDFSKKKSGKSFTDSNLQQRNDIIAELDSKKGGEDELSFFYNSIKQLTVQAYTTSKFYLTNVNVYHMIPGRFKGCVPVKA